MQKQIEDLLQKYPKHAVRMIRRNSELLKWVHESSPNITLPLPIQLRCVLYNEIPECPCGSEKIRNLISIKDGFRFCGGAGKCSAAREQLSKNCIESAKKLDTAASQQKRVASNLSKYGVVNSGQTSRAKSAHREFYQDPEKVQKILAQVHQTNLERYGVANPQQRDEIKVKTAITNAAKSPDEKQRIRDKIITTCQDRYGANSPVESPVIQAKIRKTNQSKYGVDYGLSSPVIQKKIRETNIKIGGFSHPSQFHYAPTTFDILTNKEKLSELLSRSTIIQAANELGVNGSTVGHYHNKHGLTILKPNSSSYENEIAYWLTENHINFKQHDHTICNPYELDFFLEEHNLAIEFNGLYWHSDRFKDAKYHAMKQSRCQSKNIQLLTIFEDEWLKNSGIIKKHLLHICNKTHITIGARKFSLRIIDSSSARTFLDANHIQGSTKRVSICVGAFIGKDLRAVVTLSKDSNEVYDITRYATDQLGSYPGLFSKFLSFLKRNFSDILEVVSFADLRWSLGNVYQKNGFSVDHIIAPDYFYVKNLERYHKFLYRKSAIAAKFGIDISGKTEKQLMEELGFSRIWDCGKIKYRKTL